MQDLRMDALMTRTTYAYWIRGRAFAELAAKSIESIKRFDRFIVDRRFLVITDDKPEPETSDELRAIFAPQVDICYMNMHDKQRPAMVANLDAQILALHWTPEGERVLFLDADTLMLQPFPWTDADIHATWRPDVNGDVEMARQQPWNAGVIGVNVTPAVIEAFIWLRQRVLKMSKQNQAWYGNQLALADLLGQPNGGKDRRIRWTLEDAGIPLSVCELPCSVWNYSPSGPDEDVSGKGILHMKGNRKDLIEHYAARLVA